MSKGGAAPYRKGAEYERLVQRHYEHHGWLVVRQPKSQSPFDLLAISPEPMAVKHLVQCKLRGKIGKQEREDLVSLSHRFHFSPVLAYERPIQLRYLDYEQTEVILENYNTG